MLIMTYGLGTECTNCGTPCGIRPYGSRTRKFNTELTPRIRTTIPVSIARGNLFLRPYCTVRICFLRIMNRAEPVEDSSLAPLHLSMTTATAEQRVAHLQPDCNLKIRINKDSCTRVQRTFLAGTLLHRLLLHLLIQQNSLFLPTVRYALRPDPFLQIGPNMPQVHRFCHFFRLSTGQFCHTLARIMRL